MEKINYLPLFLSAVSGFVFIEFWYSSACFGNRFLYLLGKTKVDLKNPDILWTTQLIQVISWAVSMEIVRINIQINTLGAAVLMGTSIGILIFAPAFINDLIRGYQQLQTAAIIIFGRIIQAIVMAVVLIAFAG